MKLDREFYSKSAIVVAKELIGKILVRKINNNILKGKIVETEAYIGDIDKACHAYAGKRTPRVEPLYAKPGTIYVYFIYGMYYCFNISTGVENKAEGVLIRAIEPIYAINYMSLNRYNQDYNDLNNYKKKNLTNGPSKLAQSFDINIKHSWIDITNNEEIYIEDCDERDFSIIKTKRIGIDYSEEAKDFLWRFYKNNNIYVSKK